MSEKYSTNWCDLPMEMRSECIKRMNCQTRNRLRATSRTEQALVDAKMYFFETVHLKICENLMSLKAENTDNINLFREIHIKTDSNHKKIVKCLVKILKTCDIGTFQFTDKDSYPKTLQFWPKIERCAPFRFKTFTSNKLSINVKKFLENCVGVETILIDSTPRPSTGMLSLPAVINAKVFQVTDPDPDMTYLFVQKLIDFNADFDEVDFDFFNPPSVCIERFATKLKDRVIYKKVNELRIRTNDESKHLLIRRNKFAGQLGNSLFSCTVIPSDLLESDYKKSTWFKEITQCGSAYEDYLDEYYEFGFGDWGDSDYDYEDEEDDEDEFGYLFPFFPPGMF